MVGEEFRLKIEFEEMVGSSGWRGRGENLLIDNSKLAKAPLYNDYFGKAQPSYMYHLKKDERDWMSYRMYYEDAGVISWF